MSNVKKIVGNVMPKHKFQLQESYKTLNIDFVLDVLNGNLTAYRVLEYLPRNHCQKITANFWNSSNKVHRMGYGDDGVEAYYIGASHIEKDTDRYLDDVQKCELFVNSLYDGAANPLDIFRESLRSVVEIKQIEVRAAQHNNMYAGHSKAVYWNNSGHFILEPHDDLAQLTDPRQKGFEIQEVSRVMAVNFYPSVAINSGQLKIWNIEPSEESRKQLNLTYSGFPYPVDLLSDFESMVIPVETGDLCVINGNLIHAVLRGDRQSSLKNRLLITCFMGFKNQHQLVWWT